MDKLRLFLTARTPLLWRNFAQNPTQESSTFARLNDIKLPRFSHLGNICRMLSNNLELRLVEKLKRLCFTFLKNGNVNG